MIDGPLRGRQHINRRDRIHQEPRRHVPATRAPSHRRVPRRRDSARRSSRSARLGAVTPGTLRLPGPQGSPWSGIVRCECSTDLNPAQRSSSRNQTRGDAAALRVGAAQGHARSAEPVSDRRPRTRPPPPTRRSSAALPKPPKRGIARQPWRRGAVSDLLRQRRVTMGSLTAGKQAVERPPASDGQIAPSPAPVVTVSANLYSGTRISRSLVRATTKRRSGRLWRCAGESPPRGHGGPRARTRESLRPERDRGPDRSAARRLPLPMTCRALPAGHDRVDGAHSAHT